jgi:hypothetical protein
MITAILRRLLGATAAVAILTAATPLVPDVLDGVYPFDASSAAARRGGDDSGSRGGDSDNSGHGGGDDSGHGGHGGDDNSGPGRGGDDSGHGGHGGDDNSGPGRGDDDHDDGDDDFGRRGGHHIDRATGAKIEVEGNSIEIVYPDGWKEELENGIFELKDPSGRTVIERRATRRDIARLRAIAN